MPITASNYVDLMGFAILPEIRLDCMTQWLRQHFTGYLFKHVSALTQEQTLSHGPNLFQISLINVKGFSVELRGGGGVGCVLIQKILNQESPNCVYLPIASK